MTGICSHWPQAQRSGPSPGGQAPVIQSASSHRPQTQVGSVIALGKNQVPLHSHKDNSVTLAAATHRCSDSPQWEG